MRNVAGRLLLGSYVLCLGTIADVNATDSNLHSEVVEQRAGQSPGASTSFLGVAQDLEESFRSRVWVFMQPRLVRNGTSGTEDRHGAEDLMDLIDDIPLRVWAMVADGLSVIALLLCVSCLIQCANARNPTCCGIPCGGQRMILVS